MHNFKHNESHVVIPHGYQRFEVKQLIQDRADLDGNCRSVLWYVLDQSLSFVFTVAGIRKRLGWGEHRWVTTREKLVSRGILTVRKHVLQDRSTKWQVTFDFTKLVSSRPPGDPPPHQPGDHERSPETRG